MTNDCDYGVFHCFHFEVLIVYRFVPIEIVSCLELAAIVPCLVKSGQKL